MFVDPAWVETNYYEVLGIAADAPAAEVVRAYRERVRALHPDVSDVPDAAVRFVAASHAYSVLGDPQRRRAYDRARRGLSSRSESTSPTRIEIVDVSHPTGQPASAALPWMTLVGSWSLWCTDPPAAPADVVADLMVPFGAALRGSIGSVEVPGRGAVVLEIPPGTTDGTVIRLPTRGAPGPRRRRFGDLVITIRVDHPARRWPGDRRQHPWWRSPRAESGQ